MQIVLQKYIASSGYCSRRKAEELIRSGKVLVNEKIAELGQKVSENDVVQVDGEKIEAQSEKIYIKLNKPRGYTCTNKKFKGEKNVFELLKKESLRDKLSDLTLTLSFKQGEGTHGQSLDNALHVVGRLDKDSRGLVILTNDGDFTMKMTHPKHEHEKEYIVSITNYELAITNYVVNDIIFRMRKGVDIGGVDGEGYGYVKAKNIEFLGEKKFRVVLTEGKKRQIRRMFEVLGFAVEDLKRVRMGDILLGDLGEGEWERFIL